MEELLLPVQLSWLVSDVSHGRSDKYLSAIRNVPSNSYTLGQHIELGTKSYRVP